MKDTQTYLADFLAGTFSSGTQKQQLDEALKQQVDLRQELEEVSEIWESLEKLPSYEVPPQADTAFYAMLQEAQSKPTKGGVIPLWRQYARYAAAVAAVVMAFGLGRWSVSTSQAPPLPTASVQPDTTPPTTQRPAPTTTVQQTVAARQATPTESPKMMAEIGQLKREMQQTRALLVLSMLKRESAADRLQALDYSYEIAKPDPEILSALVRTLDTDPNTNVRLAAVDALSNFSNEAAVRRAMALSLLKQQEATVQLSLIDALTRLRERQAVVQIKHLIDNEDTPNQVRERAEESLRLLSL